MTKDDIMRMGREAGMHDPMIFIGAYERFANLVADAAAAAEREACAQLCEALCGTGSINAEWMRERCAVAIRARGTHD